ncbi:DUF4429 domain-containing protein [Streptomyces zingiberis]|uniref:DUF4429 domain-containing protein n=1 Tax=Streptomyces zingiberis TaxID=2053010 RepID=A0ABX1BXV5_9ACTN|nr:DUF4429 domain-containing protein [Streptomyces zingiberis]NJQ02521.1 DUF4429 domain-containing protein [Streptomyces zingiberis]
MAEITQRDGTWHFDGETIRIVPGHDKGVGPFRRALGELAVPLRAVAGISHEPGRRGGRLRLRLRHGADPVLQITGGKLRGPDDPYQLAVAAERADLADYCVDEVRNALLLDQVEPGPVDRYLLPGPSVPVTAGAGDGTVHFDGERILLEWNWKTEESKKSGGPRVLALREVESVEWSPSAGLENGYLRFVPRGAASGARVPAKYDPFAVDLYGFRKDPLMALVAAAVAARLPHPAAPRRGPGHDGPDHDGPASPGTTLTPETGRDTPRLPDAGAPPAAPAPGPGGDDHDVLLRRLRELGELHRAGVLTDEEFTAAKQAILSRF